MWECGISLFIIGGVASIADKLMNVSSFLIAINANLKYFVFNFLLSNSSFHHYIITNH